MTRLPVMLGALLLVALGAGGGAVGTPAHVRQNGAIAVQGLAGLYLVEPATGARRLLPGIDGDEFSWSKDGGFVAFSGRDGVYTAQVSGGAPRLVMRNAWSSSLSPDARGVVVQAGDDCAEPACRWAVAIYAVEADGADPQRLTSVGEPDGGSPLWSPTGEWIVYPSFGIYRVRPDGTGRSTVIYDGWDSPDPVAWSPDGQWLAYASLDGDFYRLFRVRSDGTGLEALTGRVEQVFNINWSPDSSTIAFDHIVSEPTGTEVTLIDLKTREQRDLPGPRDSYAPAWSPDGTQLTFLGCDRVRSAAIDNCNRSGADLWVIGADGTDLRRLSGGWYDAVGLPTWLPATAGS